MNGRVGVVHIRETCVVCGEQINTSIDNCRYFWVKAFDKWTMFWRHTMCTLNPEEAKARRYEEQVFNPIIFTNNKKRKRSNS